MQTVIKLDSNINFLVYMFWYFHKYLFVIFYSYFQYFVFILLICTVYNAQAKIPQTLQRTHEVHL